MAKAVLTAACVWQAAVVVLVGQVSTTVGAAATVNVAVQVETKGAQLLLYVNVTVVEPPQMEGYLVVVRQSAVAAAARTGRRKPVGKGRVDRILA
ncbi:MAG: hypothetical protein IPM82_20490 [Saprospiraceae bacterium]|nr:hypothetical protein [Saprospiraceae bacterium]